MAKDVILNEENDLDINQGDFVLGKSIKQEVGIILLLSQGGLKSDVLLGANLLNQIRTVGNELKIRTKIKKALLRDGKNYEKLKKQIQINA